MTPADVRILRAAIAAYDTRANEREALANAAGQLRAAAKNAVDAWDMGGGDADALRRHVARLEDELASALQQLDAAQNGRGLSRLIALDGGKR